MRREVQAQVVGVVVLEIDSTAQPRANRVVERRNRQVLVQPIKEILRAQFHGAAGEQQREHAQDIHADCAVAGTAAATARNRTSNSVDS